VGLVGAGLFDWNTHRTAGGAGLGAIAQAWHYVKVPQAGFEKLQPSDFVEL
jgi:hypothetical protein